MNTQASIKGSNVRIAIVCAHWPVHRMVVYLARALSRDQFAVDLLTYSAPMDDSIELLYGLPVTVHHLLKTEDRLPVLPTKWSLANRVFGRLKRLSTSVGLVVAPTATLFHNSVRRRLRELIRKSRYTLILAVEKGGLALAGDALRHIECPLVYYSLELYTADHPLLRADPRMAALHRLERKFASPKHVYIIQDDARWNVLKNDLGIEHARARILLAVSEPAEPCPESSRFLRDRLAIPDEMKILLYYGVVRPERDSLSVAGIADELPDDWVLVFHGPCSNSTAQQILGKSTRRKIVMSRVLVPSAEREQLIKSADIGLAVYRQTSANDRLTGSSSEKIALYLKCGVPIIGHDNETYANIWELGGGLPISDISQIPSVIATMAPRLGYHRIAARRVYEERYSFERNYLRVLSCLSDIGFCTQLGAGHLNGHC